MDSRGAYELNVAYFGAIIGKNVWRDFTQLWIVANATLPMEKYPLMWSMVSGRDISSKVLTMAPIKGVKGKFPFEDKDFEAIRFVLILSDLYQAINRINRDNTRSAEVFIVNNDANIIDALSKHLPVSHRRYNRA